ncbi:hypothetical protein [Bradyrhizobium liaoningense]
MFFEFYSEETAPQQPPVLGKPASFVSPADLSRIASKTDLELSWREFVSWLTFKELSRSLARKAASIDQTSLRLLSESIFSIEVGLTKIVKRWSVLRKLSYPQDSCVYNAYSFVQTCMMLKRSLPAKEAEQLKRRVLSGLLPNGRLADIDLELRIWWPLSREPSSIVHFGVLGEAGPDFLVSGNGSDIEIEGKCISPETGMPLSYSLISPLMKGFGDGLQGRYPDTFVTIEAEVRDTHPTGRAVPAFRTQIERTYSTGQDIVTPELTTRISFRSLSEVTAEFGPIEHNSSKLFGKYRRQFGDFGFFTGDQSEGVFLNIIPLSPRRTLKKMMRIISDAGEQFSKTRPAILWLHLLGLPDHQSEGNDEGMLDMIDRLLDHAFSRKRDYISIVVFSSDTRLVNKHTFGTSKLIRGADGRNHKRFYANPNARFPLTNPPPE